MQKPIALILGATGGIGEATRQVFLDAGYRVIPVGRDLLDFNLSTAEIKAAELLNSAQADVVINCVGVFINGYHDSHHKTMNINFGSNWEIIRYYQKCKDSVKPTKIIMVGSSSYNHGKLLYPLYSASKAALYNLWESSRDIFQNTNVFVDLLNPMRTRTRMIADHYNPELPYHTPQEVANEILKLAKNFSSCNCVNMTLKESK